jgi:hypothetical protein
VLLRSRIRLPRFRLPRLACERCTPDLPVTWLQRLGIAAASIRVQTPIIDQQDAAYGGRENAGFAPQQTIPEAR